MKRNKNLKLIAPMAAFALMAGVVMVGCGGDSGGVATNGGATTGATTGSTTGGNQQQFNSLTLRVDTVEAIDAFDLGSQADFKASISVGSQTSSFGPITNSSTINPGWSRSANVTGLTTVGMTIIMTEEDAGLAGADDDVDLDPKANALQVNINVNPFSGAITGDVSGQVGDTFTLSGANDSANAAKITFTVTGN